MVRAQVDHCLIMYIIDLQLFTGFYFYNVRAIVLNFIDY